MVRSLPFQGKDESSILSEVTIIILKHKTNQNMKTDKPQTSPPFISNESKNFPIYEKNIGEIVYRFATKNTYGYWLPNQKDVKELISKLKIKDAWVEKGEIYEHGHWGHCSCKNITSI